MIICVPRQAYTPDMLVAGKIPLPESFQFAIGNGIDLEMHGGRLRGRLTITGKDPDPRWFRCLWTCPGSQYDGREFVVSPGTYSEVAGHGQSRVFPSPYELVTTP